MGKRKVAILGSTGSIGRQALEVIAEHPELFEVELITANTSYELLAEQAIKFDVNNAVICDENCYEKARSLLSGSDVKLFSGIDSVCSLVASDRIDIVLASFVGFSGLKPVIAAIKAGKPLALANKETLVAAGKYVTELAESHSVPIIPVDSEHSAIFQALQGSFGAPVEKLLITASGGPFLSMTREQMSEVSAKQALAHPRWKMGAKITIDSATMMNKGFEVIEARWLFDMPADKIEVVVHPESIIHSMVQYQDGAVIAQLGLPDMKIPIQYAMTYPRRESIKGDRLDLTTLGRLTFKSPDFKQFPTLEYAYECLRKGGNACCILNGANEEAVAAFLKGRIRFTDISDIIAQTLDTCEFIESPDIDTIFATDSEARKAARDIINSK